MQFTKNIKQDKNLCILISSEQQPSTSTVIQLRQKNKINKKLLLNTIISLSDINNINLFDL